MSKSLGERFWEKVDCAGAQQHHMPTCCWEWQGCKNQDGYGRLAANFVYGKRLESAHRLSLAFVLGYMPKYVMHKCDNPACVRPSHLKEGTHKENTKEAYDKGRQPRRHNYRGVAVYNAKLTEENVRTIRRRCGQGELQKVVAKDLGVTMSTVQKVVSRKICAHVT